MVTHDGREVGFVKGHHVFEVAAKALNRSSTPIWTTFSAERWWRSCDAERLNKAVCGLVKRAAEASGLGAELMAEDLSAPIQRPSLKVELEEDRDARAIRHRVEQAITSGSISSQRISTGPSWTTWPCARPWRRHFGTGPRGGGDGAHRRGAVLYSDRRGAGGIYGPDPGPAHHSC